MNNILISVIVPIYNSGKYLDRCLQSILDQTFKNIEIILIDDGSTDNSLSICNMYREKYNNIKVYSQENSGQGVARNLGISKAEGRFISFIDSDDYIDKNMYECMLELGINNNCDIIICGNEIVYDEKKLSISCDRDINDYKILCTRDEKMKYYLTNNISSYPCDKLFKRDLLIKNNIRFPENCYFEDVNMVLKCLYYSSNIIITDSPFYKYIQRHNSTTYTRTEKHLNDFKNEITNCYKFIYEHCYNENIEIEVRNYKFIHTNMLLKMIKDLKKEYEFESYFRVLPENIIIFGASSAGELMKYYCDLFDINIVYFCDNGEQKWGAVVNDIEIIAPKQLKDIKENYSIYIASMYYQQIYNQLMELGLENRIVDLEIF